MTMNQTKPPAQILREIQNRAQLGGCFVREREGRFEVFRKTPARAVYLGSRSSLPGLRTFVNNVTR